MLSIQSVYKVRDASGQIVELGVLDLEGATPSVSLLGCTPATVVATLTAPAGSTGLDWSVGAPIAPLVGSLTFGGDNPTYSGWTLLQTIPSNPGACERLVCNNSNAPILIVLDDGTADGGSTPINSSVFLLNPPSTSQPNTLWRSDRFKGRLRFFGPSTSAWITITEA